MCGGKPYGRSKPQHLERYALFDTALCRKDSNRSFLRLVRPALSLLTSGFLFSALLSTASCGTIAARSRNALLHAPAISRVRSRRLTALFTACKSGANEREEPRSHRL